MRLSFEEDIKYFHSLTPYCTKIDVGYVSGMNVPCKLFVNENLKTLVEDEMHHFHESQGKGFIPASMQIANVASLPGIVGHSVGLPDMHSGYGFAIGNVAAFDMNDPNAIVSPGGVGFDINCGVRLLRTNLLESDIRPLQKELSQSLFDAIPVGVGTKGSYKFSNANFDSILNHGMKWAVDEGICWEEDREFCEENGKMAQASADAVSTRAKTRGIQQLGTMGAGNHYAEIQAVEEIYDEKAAKAMGINQVGQVCVMIHSGSRGLGHQVATDALTIMDKVMKRDNIVLNDRQLACTKITSPEGQEYLRGMSAAANFAFVNRSLMAQLARKAFVKTFKADSAEDLGMHTVYDVSHNIAKVEEHFLDDGRPVTCLVHRKGATRAFPPGHPLIPLAYQEIGQPVLIGGSMGTCSYVLTGTEVGMRETFGSTCHGAGRASSRAKSRKKLNSADVLKCLEAKGISIAVATPDLISEEAPESYKDVTEVVNTCESAGISKKSFKLKPLCVIKG